MEEEKIVKGMKDIRDDLQSIVDDINEDDRINIIDLMSYKAIPPTIKGVLVKDGVVRWYEHVEIVPDDNVIDYKQCTVKPLIIKVEHKWNNMSCHICSRGQHDAKTDIIDGCDLCVPGVRDDGYCALFIPNEGRVKSKRDIVGMMEMHAQRWIRERSNFR